MIEHDFFVVWWEKQQLGSANYESDRALRTAAFSAWLARSTLPEELISKWVPVSERMPERYRPCIVAFEMHPGYKSSVCQDTLVWDGHRWCVGGVSDLPYRGTVTHWMPLPDAPVSPLRLKEE